MGEFVLTFLSEVSYGVDLDDSDFGFLMPSWAGRLLHVRLTCCLDLEVKSRHVIMKQIQFAASIYTDPLLVPFLCLLPASEARPTQP